jgi:hypothetical protein
MRTIIDLPESQLTALGKLCATERISRAEAVRRAVDRLLADSTPSDPGPAFGLWKKKGVNSRKFVDKIRREWASR